MEAPADLVAFCRRQHPQLVRLLDLYIGDLGTAEELAQEALLRACERWERVGDLQEPDAWLRTVAMNLARSHWRRRGAERRARARVESYARVPAAQADADEAVTVRTALQRLPEKQRRVLVLRYFAGLPAADVAAVVGGTAGNVRVITHRAVAALRAELGPTASFALEEAQP